MSSDLSDRLRVSEQRLKERSERLYELQQLYSSEHFALQKCMRDLKTERLRNAGAYGQLENVIDRMRELQVRIAELKVRLRRYESVEDTYLDTESIRVERIDDVP